MGVNITYDIFESIFMELLNKMAPIKEKYVKANNAAFMNKTLRKVIMNRSRCRNKYLKHPNNVNKLNLQKATELLCEFDEKREKENITKIWI